MNENILVLLRHGESVWNQKNLFTGWTDVDLTDNGKEEAREAGRLLRENGYELDLCYTSYLKRAIHTMNLALEALDAEWIPTIKTWKLNERHYGALQGLNKKETAEKYGEHQVKIWRRSFDVRPPMLTPNDERNPALHPHYRHIPVNQLPLGESLKDTFYRVIPYYEETIRPQLQKGNRVMITAHGNTIRALMMYLEQLTSDEVLQLNIPTGVPLVYKLNEDLVLVHKQYLGDPDKISKRQKAAASGAAAAK